MEKEKKERKIYRGVGRNKENSEEVLQLDQSIKTGTERILHRHAGGRPACQFTEDDYDLMQNLAHIFCTQEEIASVFNCDIRTLTKNPEFMRRYKLGREQGKQSLRRMQYKLAEKNVAMALWLGKQYLGQRDLIEEQSTKPISVISDVKIEETEQSSVSSYQSNGDDYNVIDIEEEGK